MTKKCALITGGAKRIGRSISLFLASIGYDIAIHYNNSKQEADSLLDEIRTLNQDAFLFQCDLSIQSEVEKLIPNVAEKMKGLDLLVNSASIFKPSKLDSIKV